MPEWGFQVGRRFRGSRDHWAQESNLFSLAQALSLSCLLAAWTGTLQCATFVVTTNSDAGPGSLRQALFDSSATGGGAITFSNVSGTIILDSPLSSLAANTFIMGPGASMLTVSGGKKVRVLTIGESSSTVLCGLTVADGFVTNDYGGGIFNSGSLTISNCLLVNNVSTPGRGGAVFSRGSLKLYSSTISSNLAAGANAFDSTSGSEATGLGGAIFVESGLVSVWESTFHGNQARGALHGLMNIFPQSGGAAVGGAIFVLGGRVAVERTTFSNNSGLGGSGLPEPFTSNGGSDGGIAAGGALGASNGIVSLVNCTLSGNQARGGSGASANRYGGRGGDGFGGGVFVRGAEVSFANCTVFQNQAIGGDGGWGSIINGSSGMGLGAGVYGPDGANLSNTLMQDSRGALASLGHNLLESTNGFLAILPSDLVDPDLSRGLGPLQDNGGSTLTHALLGNSHAIDGGSLDGTPVRDQRGVIRPAGAACDIGAYEFVGASRAALTEGNHVQVDFLIWTNQSFPVQATVDLIHWDTVGTIPPSSTGQTSFQDTADLKQRFFRLVLP